MVIMIIMSILSYRNLDKAWKNKSNDNIVETVHYKQVTCKK